MSNADSTTIVFDEESFWEQATEDNERIDEILATENLTDRWSEIMVKCFINDTYNRPIKAIMESKPEKYK